ncbi:MAG: cupredoxin domain-containing protein, partial [Firmicutes bacterium]|nr:cupredoxin domain-containing protein [Bacillota bacterium]
IKVKPGEAVRILFTNIGGTSGDKVVLASDAAGIAKFELKSGGRKVVEIKATAEPGKIEVKNLEDSLGKPFVIEVDPDAGQKADKPANAPAGQGGAREVKLETRQLQFNIKSLKVKAGEKIRFVLTNNDDEKHNLVMLTQGIMSPDVNGGKTGSFDLTMPVMAGTYRFTCTYHPATGFDLIVE